MGFAGTLARHELDGKPEVSNDSRSLVSDKNVLALEIPMSDGGLVSVITCFAAKNKPRRKLRHIKADSKLAST